MSNSTATAALTPLDVEHGSADIAALRARYFDGYDIRNQYQCNVLDGISAVLAVAMDLRCPDEALAEYQDAVLSATVADNDEGDHWDAARAGFVEGFNMARSMCSYYTAA